MAKYKYHNRKQMKILPINLEEQLHPGTLEYTIDYLIDNKIDLSLFDERYKNDDTGRPAWDPAIMLKIILFAYSRGITSSRRIARACRENVVFMSLSVDSQPHFTTIADFISTMDKKITKIFQEVLLVCSELDLIGGEYLAIDGCKLSSNASKEWSGTKKQLFRKKEKIKIVIKDLLKTHKVTDKTETDKSTGKNNQIEKLQKKIERIEKFLETNEDKKGKRGHINQSNITDNESAKIKSSHGMVQGYNGIGIVDSKNQIIIHAEAFGTGPETEVLEPMVTGAKENIKAIGKDKNYFEGKKLLGDTGYHTEKNCKLLEEEKIDGYLPDQKFRKRDPRFKTAITHKPPQKPKRFERNDFKYNKKKDIYICPAGKTLTLDNKNVKLGIYEGRKYKAKIKDCSNCKLKRKCLRKETTSRRYLFIINKIKNRNYSEEMKNKIDTLDGREHYSKR
ncbi:MAG: IS1182 family transposase, partial [archaeon]|nr:IS1182 family transposase [archaeon]